MTKYLALGDSMSIDVYTGVQGGGAASQFARRLPAEVFQDLTRDGHTTMDVISSLAHATDPPDVITLTVGGNDLLSLALVGGRMPPDAQAWCNRAVVIGERLEEIARHLLMAFGSQPMIVFNTVYDPTDGDNAKLAEMGLPDGARVGLMAYNDTVRLCARILGKVGGRTKLCDAYNLFCGHGYWSQEPWLTQYIEPNLAGATALADDWLRRVRADPDTSTLPTAP